MALASVAMAIGLADSGLRPFSLNLKSPPPAPVEPSLAERPSLDSIPDLNVAARRVEPTPTVPAANSDEGFITTAQAKVFHDRLFAQGDVVFVDARNRDEFEAAHISASLHIPPDAFFGGQLPPEMDMAPKSYTIVVYCGGGECDASKLVALRFKEQAYSTVYVYQEGFAGWTAAKLPTQKGGQ